MSDPSGAETAAQGAVDPITLEVINNRVDEIVREMQHVMFRTGYSTIIRDMKDGSAGICLADGRVVGQAFRLPLHCGVFPPTIRSIRRDYPLEDIHEGDTFVVNDPYRSGANHSPDLMVATPMFDDGDLQAWCCTIAHKPDIGGLAPGSTSPESREIYHEGLLLPPVKYARGGEVNDAVERIIRNNSRAPRVTMGDVRGQVNSTNVSIAKLGELFDEYGAGTVGRAADQLLDSTERELARVVEPWDGSVTVEGRFDGNVTGEEPIYIQLTLTTEAGDPTLAFDFTGSDPQSEGPSNMQPHVIESACMIGVVGIVDPDLPLNSGVAEVCEWTLPEGSVVNPTHPAPCGNYAKSQCVVMHLALRALSEFAPENAVAETGNKASFVASYETVHGTGGAGNGDGAEDGDGDEENVVHFEIVGSGYGGNRLADGASCMATGYESNVMFTPIEIVETEFPTRLRAFEPREDSAGPGAHRGGLGFVREYEFLAEGELTYGGTNHVVRAQGTAGGGASAHSTCEMNPGEDSRALDPFERIDISTGDVMRVERSGGGGYGDPHDRDPEAVLADVRKGFVSREGARDAYGVAIVDGDDGLTVDQDATADLRE